MKHLLFILLLAFIGRSEIYAHESNKLEPISLSVSDEGRDITRKENDGENAPVARSIIFQPAYAYLCDKVVSVAFEEALSSVTINIVNEQSGETVYSQNYMNPVDLNIDLSNAIAGEYRIDIVAEEVSLQGIFSL